MLDTIEGSQNGRHFGKFEVIHVHINMQLHNPFKNGFLLVELHKEGSQDPLGDALTAAQMQRAGNEITEVIVPYLGMCFFGFQREDEEALFFRLEEKDTEINIRSSILTCTCT